jgi:hypothetical protein
MAKSVFNVIPEDVKKPHVHNNMKESSVEKHGAEKREILLEPCKLSRKFWVRVPQGNDSIEVKGLF